MSILLAYQAPIEVLEPGEDGGPPKRLGPGRFAVDEVPVAVPDGSVMVRDYTGPIELPPATPAVELVVRVRRNAELAKSHEEHARLLISIIDHIEFSLQQQVQVVAFDALDTSPTLAVGQQREFTSYGGGASSFGGRLLSSPQDTRWNFFGTGRISVSGIAEPEGKVPLARWWYLKALASPFAIDSYLALWTALELLSRIEKATVHGPLKLQCGHELGSCPACDKRTTKEVNGLTMKHYLRSCGVNDEDAEVMWRLRQAVHGRNMFGEEESRQLERQLGQLRAVVFIALKKRLMIQIDELPAVSFAGGPVISGWASLGGAREIEHNDLQLEQNLVLQDATT
jgi:hypothetical protein